MRARRLALFLAALPAAFYVYACSSDSSDSGTTSPDSGAPSDNSIPRPTPDSGETDTDSGSSTDAGDGGSTGDGGDAGDAGAVLCSGNPLTADGGVADGGTILSADGGIVRQALSINGDYLDGPQFTDIVDGGSLVFSDLYTATIMYTGPDGGPAATLRTMTVGTELPIGNAVKGNAILTAWTNSTGGGGIVQTYADGGPGPALLTGASADPNDLAVAASSGIVYVTRPGFQTGSQTTWLSHVNPDGGVVVDEQFSNYDRVNGIALSPDEKTLYVSITEAKKVVKYTIGTDGKATGRTDFVTTVNIPDGIAVDAAGNLWVAEVNGTNDTPPVLDKGTVEVFAADGKKWGAIDFPNHRPVGVAFGGADNKAVYIVANQEQTTTNGFVFIYQSRCAGIR